MIEHHASPELVLDYAAGGMAEPLSVLMACHASLCPSCRVEIDRLETIGGELLETLEPEAMAADAPETVLARLDEPEPQEPPLPPLDDETVALLPAPLRRYVGGNLSDLPWRWRGRSMREVVLPVGVEGWQVSLFRVRAGGVVPAHRHGRAEHTLVLQGGLTDRNGGHHITAGDVETADSGHIHRQIADEGADCLCLAVLDAPIRLTGPLGWIANRLIRF
jgi:putative transcriptional regulator